MISLEETICNAKKSAEHDGYDQYIIRDNNNQYWFTRKWRPPDKQQEYSAKFNETVIGIVTVTMQKGLPTTNYKTL